MFGCFDFGKLGGRRGEFLSIWLKKMLLCLYVRRTQTQNQPFCGKISSISKWNSAKFLHPFPLAENLGSPFTNCNQSYEAIHKDNIKVAFSSLSGEHPSPCVWYAVRNSTCFSFQSAKLKLFQLPNLFLIVSVASELGDGFTTEVFRVTLY